VRLVVVGLEAGAEDIEGGGGGGRDNCAGSVRADLISLML
jgi:hypothetical protein